MTSSTLSRPHNLRTKIIHPLAGHPRLELRVHTADETILAALERSRVMAQRYSATLLRYSLALIFCWFGALKVAGRSPVYDLLSATLPWFNPQVIVPLIGVVELTLGI